MKNQLYNTSWERTITILNLKALAGTLIVCHIAGGSWELGVGLDDFVHCFQKVLLGRHLATCTNGKHACLSAHGTNFRTWNNNNVSTILYKNMVENWLLLNNSKFSFEEVAIGGEKKFEIINEELYNRFVNTIQKWNSKIFLLRYLNVRNYFIHEFSTTLPL